MPLQQTKQKHKSAQLNFRSFHEPPFSAGLLDCFFFRMILIQIQKCSESRKLRSRFSVLSADTWRVEFPGHDLIEIGPIEI